MRKRLLSLIALLPLAASAQTVATFETPALPKADTFFMSYDMPKQDIGINSGLAHFPLYADTGFGFQFWDHGFTYSNMTDSSSGGYGNQYSARTGIGANGSSQYAVAYGEINKVFLLSAAQGKSVAGFYATNSSYAYYSLKFGDGFARKFGDTTGTNSHLPQGSYPDFFKLVVQGYLGGVLKPDTVEFYLADYRASDSTKDYVVKDWQWVPLTKLGGVDSLQFRLYSTDTNSFGIKTPLYFCMDDFTTNESVGVKSAQSIIAKVYPNPVQSILHIELADNISVQSLTLLDMSGKVVIVQSHPSKAATVDMSALAPGSYLLQLQSASGQVASQVITRQ